MPLKLPSDFAKKVAETLGMTAQGVDQLFDFSEDKKGFFIAKLKPKQFLDTKFRPMCALVRDLGGEDYVKGAMAWKVPGPYAKKGDTTSTSEDARSKQQGPKLDFGNAPRSVTDDKSKPPELSAAAGQVIFTVLPIRALLSMPFQSRKNIEGQSFADLVESVKTVGILEPTLVRQKPNGLYEIVAGERRVAAAKKAGLTEVPAIVKILSDQEAYEIQLVENVQREDLTDMEKARMLDMMIKKFGYLQKDLAKKLGKSEGWVSHHLTMLQLDARQVQTADNIEKLVPGQVQEGKLTERQAREILAASPEKREEILDKINETGKVPSSREIHEAVRGIICSRCGDPISGPPVNLKGSYYCQECAEQLQAEAVPSLVPEQHVGPFEKESAEAEEEPQPYIVKRKFDVWSIAVIDTQKPFGDPDYPGGIPGDIVGNVLLWFLPNGGKVVDPMAGGGVTEDVCKAFATEKYPYVMFDSKRLNNYHYRDSIKYADVLQGKLPPEADNADLIFADPPYGPLKEYGMSIDALYKLLTALAAASYRSLKPGGIAAVLMQNYYVEGECEGEFIPLVRKTAEIFELSGFKQTFEITVPLYGKVPRSKVSMTHIDRRLLVFLKR